jgi:enamine deaminase RidA (YjgF/YER057c/UK114 family)
MTQQTDAPANAPAVVNPPALPDPTERGYSTAVVAPAGSRLAFVSGQGGFDRTGALPDDFAAQIDLAYQALLAAVAGLGVGPERVVKLTLYVVDHDPAKLGPLTAAVIRSFGDTLPAQTLVGVPALAVPGMLFEVEAVVAVD